MFFWSRVKNSWESLYSQFYDLTRLQQTIADDLTRGFFYERNFFVLNVVDKDSMIAAIAEMVKSGQFIHLTCE